MDKVFYALINLAFVISLGYYIESAMQWYSYKLERVIFHYNKPLWHILFFAVPLVVYYAVMSFDAKWSALLSLYPVALFFWYKKLDKPLKFTNRVKRFFLFLFLSFVFEYTLWLFFQYRFSAVLIPLFAALFLSGLYEKMLFLSYQKEAERKLLSMRNLRIIAITASYGKTSIKNFLHHILASKFDSYKTPRSVNTLGGLIMDINTTLPKNTEIYIAEAGARERGDIKDIALFLKPDIVVVGEIGAQHIEYFKTLEAIRNTKMELLLSPTLQKAFVHTSANVNPNGDRKIELFGDEITFVEATLEGTKFGMKIDDEEVTFETKLLGSFNAVNLAVCVRVSLYLGLDIKMIQKAVKAIPSVEHRLQRIDAGGKIILDDSFNGNFEGMKSSYELAKTHSGRKVLITPGIVESTKEENEKLFKIADEIFDIVIITGSVNADTIDSAIKRAQKIVLKDKSLLTQTLAEQTRAGDLILFSNDAPTYM